MRLLALFLSLASPPAYAVPSDPPVYRPPLLSGGSFMLGESEPMESLSDSTLACLILSEEECGRNANAARLIAVDSRHVPLSPPVFQRGFEPLFMAYPRGSVKDVLDMIGQPTQTWIKNTCAVRVSYALNFSGVKEYPLDRSLIAQSPTRIETISHGGTDRSSRPSYVYIFRVNELAAYMLRRYGRPQVWAKKTDNARAAVHGKRGVILFVVNGWSDATGHFDLWTGQDPAGSEYFDKASDVFLWQ